MGERGFALMALMAPEKHREIASRGGHAAHKKGTAHEWTADEARKAGRKGGEASAISRALAKAQAGPAWDPDAYQDDDTTK